MSISHWTDQHACWTEQCEEARTSRERDGDDLHGAHEVYLKPISLLGLARFVSRLCCWRVKSLKSWVDAAGEPARIT